MNDRIRKMAIEADAWCDRYYFGDKFYDIEWEKKFAELIVQECVDRIKRVGILEDIEIEGDMISDAVKEHFGVK